MAMEIVSKGQVVVPDEIREVEICKLARDLEIVDDDSYEHGGIILVTIKGRRKVIAGLCNPNIARWNEGHKAALAQKRLLDNPYKDGEGTLKGNMGTFHDERERVRLAAEAKLQDDAAIAEAEAAEAAGDTEAAERALNGEGTVAPSLPPATPKVEGVSFRKIPHAEVIDRMALVKGIADGRVPLAVFEPDMTVLNGQARSLGIELNYPGVKVVFDTSTAVRA